VTRTLFVCVITLHSYTYCGVVKLISYKAKLKSDRTNNLPGSSSWPIKETTFIIELILDTVVNKERLILP